MHALKCNLKMKRNIKLVTPGEILTNSSEVNHFFIIKDFRAAESNV